MMPEPDADERAAVAVREIAVWLAVGGSRRLDIPAAQARLVAFVWMLTPELTKRASLTEFAGAVGLNAAVVRACARELEEKLRSGGGVSGRYIRFYEHFANH